MFLFPLLNLLPGGCCLIISRLHPRRCWCGWDGGWGIPGSHCPSAELAEREEGGAETGALGLLLPARATVRTDLIQMLEKRTANSRGASSPPSARKLLVSLTPASDKARGIRRLAQSHTSSWMQSQDWSPTLPDSKPNAFPQSQVGSAYLQQSPGSGLGLLPFGWDDTLTVSTHPIKNISFQTLLKL